MSLDSMTAQGGSTKFPHTRALLSALAREYGLINKPGAPRPSSDTSDSEHENDSRDGDTSGTEDLAAQVIQLLDNEDEDGVKDLLQSSFDIPDDTTVEQSVLELMHKRRDDLANVPFLFLTPIKRPSRPTSRASFRSSRPGTPVFAPSSPLAQTFRRPSTPLASANPAGTIGGGYPSSSPSSSPVPAHAMPIQPPIGTGTSPSSSPRFLNAKASEFRPTMVRSLSSSSIVRGHSPSPASSELWAHSHIPSPTLSSASLGIGRGSSNLAIAAPLLPDQPYPSSGDEHGDDESFRSFGSSTPPISIRHGAPGPDGSIPPSGLGRVVHPSFDDDDDDDPFSPFVVKPISPVAHQALHSLSNGGSRQSSGHDDAQWSDYDSHNPSPPLNLYDVPLPPHMSMGRHPSHNGGGMAMGTADEGDYFNSQHAPGSGHTPGYLPAQSSNLARHMRPGFFTRTDSNSSIQSLGYPGTPGAGPIASTGLPLANASSADALSDVAFAEQDMTPFEVLSSIFGSSVSPALLEEALDNSGYDFDGAMAWLVDQALPAPPPGLLQHSMPMRGGSAGMAIGGREGPYSPGGQGGRGPGLGNNPNGRNGSRFGGPPQGGGPQQAKNVGNRVCRYFLQGECRRADCRFSHDIDRALCRFWLRGQCAKGENCEFLHSLPQHIDMQGINSAMNRVDIHDNGNDGYDADYPPRNDFPTLGQAGNNRRMIAPGADTTRNRWASAVKKAPTPNAAIGRGGKHHLDANDPSAPVRTNAGISSRPSPRLHLRPPSLLPTLPTGDSISKLYMAYRSQALSLGAARNACLTRAAEAWRRGDGAAAKKHSREAHDLNTKMGMETGLAAARLVRERARVAVEAVRSRDGSWSDDPRDRTERGRVVGNKLGVCMGVARVSLGGDKRLTTEERTEVLLDLHGLHSGEAVEVVEDFLVALELEHFFGLAYLLIGEEKHTGSQDAARGTSRARLAAGVRDWLVKWGYPWLERDGVICVDPLTHSNAPVQ